MIAPILASIAFVVIFIVAYKYFRGYYPGSTVIEDDPVSSAVPTSERPRLKFFYTTWCPHSRAAMPEWNSFKTLLKSQKLTFGGKQLELEAIDGDSAPTTTARYGVDAYPTIVLETVEQVYHYDKKVKVDGIRSWLVQVLGPEGSQL
jgi:thiol-disulfide isomerase/thioredoxin